MSRKLAWRWAIGGMLLVGFLSVFGWGYIGTKKAPGGAQAAKRTTKVGTYLDYSYVITATTGRSQLSAQFNPAIVGDDAVVVGVLNELMRVAYDDINTADIQPVVEVVSEKHYVTFPSENGKTLFELYKSESGEVGSVKFWREPKK